MERDRGGVLYGLARFYFNSHAHVERDEIGLSDLNNLIISTHTLTWSVTKTTLKGIRMTEFQLTRSRGA